MANVGLEKFRASPKGMELEQAERRPKSRQRDLRAQALKQEATGTGHSRNTTFDDLISTLI